jgi:putative intracellular protease/amidase
MMKILIVLTSHSQLGDSGRKTGFWLSEFTDPHYIFVDNGAEVTLASPNGGLPTVHPGSEAPNHQTDATRRFASDPTAQAQLANTVKVADVRANDYDAVYFPGGHGPVWDLAEDKSVIALVEVMSAARKPIGAVCRGVAVLRHPKAANGAPLVRGRKVTGFSNTEEEKAGMPKLMPFLVEDMLRSNGGLYARADDWASFVVDDGNLVTGQNPASSKGVAEQMLKLATTTAS